MKNYNIDVAIIGAGPAGLSAALEAKRQGVKKVMILERDTHLGGILQQCIHDGFGIHDLKKECPEANMLKNSSMNWWGQILKSNRTPWF